MKSDISKNVGPVKALFSFLQISFLFLQTSPFTASKRSSVAASNHRDTSIRRPRDMTTTSPPLAAFSCKPASSTATSLLPLATPARTSLFRIPGRLLATLSRSCRRLFRQKSSVPKTTPCFRQKLSPPQPTGLECIFQACVSLSFPHFITLASLALGAFL